MSQRLADAVEQWAEDNDVTLEPRENEPPRIKAYLCDGAYLDVDTAQRELDRRMKNANRVVVLYTDGAREVRKDGTKN